MVSNGDVTVENRTLKASSIIKLGDQIRITAPGIGPSGPPPPLPPILYEDDRILVLNKPAGLLTHPAGQLFHWGIIGLAKSAYPNDRMDLAHRLDRETSGVLLLTKDVAANRFMKSIISSRKVTKEYLAIVHGRVAWTTREVHAPIGMAINSEVRLRRGVNPEGLDAHTTFHLVQQMSQHALIRCRLHTGRTHQIRIHLDHIGHPIVGDKLYGQPDFVFIEHLDHGPTARVRNAVQFPRHALHACKTQFPHPDGNTITVEAPLPEALQSIVDGSLPAWPFPTQGAT